MSHTADPYRQSRHLVWSCRCEVTSWRRSLKHLHLSWSHNRFVRLTSGVFGGHSFVSMATSRRSSSVAAWPLLGGERCHLARWGSAHPMYVHPTEADFVSIQSHNEFNSQMLSPDTLPSQYLKSAGGANQVLISRPLLFPRRTCAGSKKEGENWHIYPGITSVVSSISKKTQFETL